MPRRPDLPPFTETDLTADPFELLATWYELAREQAPLPEAICLATVDEAGMPDARMVLLKGFGPDGFRFFSNHGSAKGRQLAARPAAALVLYWRELDRQIRARGIVERLPDRDSDEYFASRMRESRIGAWASPQSRELADRGELDRLVDEAEGRFGADDIPRPEFWGGYRVVPERIEFWQGQVGRLHDRFVYRRAGDRWTIARLAP